MYRQFCNKFYLIKIIHNILEFDFSSTILGDEMKARYVNILKILFSPTNIRLQMMMSSRRLVSLSPWRMNNWEIRSLNLFYTLQILIEKQNTIWVSYCY